MKNNRFKTICKILLKNKLQTGLSPEKVRKTLDELGPTYIKIGQILATRDDILPKEYCDELQCLKESVSPLPFSFIKEQIEQELQTSIETNFLKVDPSPLACASIGQVHQAILRNSEQVVIKVMKPNIEKIVREDFMLLKKAIKYLNLFTNLQEVIDLNIILDETLNVMLEEMNFQKEIENIKLFADKYQKISYIKLPKVYEDLSTKHLLVMEYIDGIRIDNVISLKDEGYDLKEICNKLIENYITQIIDDGIFHADPHGGNILVSQGKIVWLDLGMIGKISPRDRALYKRAIKAIIAKDTYEIKRIILMIGTIKGSCNHAELYRDIENLLDTYMSMSISEMNMGIIFQEIMCLAKKHNISLPKGMTLLARSILIIQSTVAKLDQEANLMSFFYQHIKNNYEKISLKEKLPELTKKLYLSTKKASKIPQAVYDVLDLTLKGEKQQNIDIINLDRNVNKIDQMFNRLILSLLIIVSGLILGALLITLIIITKYKWLLILSAIFLIIGLIFINFLLIILIKKILKDKQK